MEWVGEWFLINRTEDDMAEMAHVAGIPCETLSFDRDSTGIQLFMTVLKE